MAFTFSKTQELTHPNYSCFVELYI